MFVVHSGRSRALVLVAIAVAGPIALGFDLIARRFVLANQPEDVRLWMAEQITHYAWFLLPGPVLGGLLGFALYRSMVRKAEVRIATLDLVRQGAEREKAELPAMLIGTTMAQVPALLGDLSVMLGARLTPALCTTAISVTMVLAIGLYGRSLTR